VQPWANC